MNDEQVEGLASNVSVEGTSYNATDGSVLNMTSVTPGLHVEDALDCDPMDVPDTAATITETLQETPTLDVGEEVGKLEITIPCACPSCGHAYEMDVTEAAVFMSQNVRLEEPPQE